MCAPSGAERCVCGGRAMCVLLGSGRSVCWEESEVCFGRCRALCVSGRKGNVVWGHRAMNFRGTHSAMFQEAQRDSSVLYMAISASRGAE